MGLFNFKDVKIILLLYYDNLVTIKKKPFIIYKRRHKVNEIYLYTLKIWICCKPVEITKGKKLFVAGTIASICCLKILFIIYVTIKTLQCKEIKSIDILQQSIGKATRSHVNEVYLLTDFHIYKSFLTFHVYTLVILQLRNSIKCRIYII